MPSKEYRITITSGHYHGNIIIKYTRNDANAFMDFVEFEGNTCTLEIVDLF